MISNWIRSFIKCFDQSLENINNLFIFSNRKEKQIWVFSIVKELIQDLNIHIKALGFLREWNRIAFVLILDYSVNKCNLFSTFCISGVVCSWGDQD